MKGAQSRQSGEEVGLKKDDLAPNAGEAWSRKKCD
jgi:hypothetical protein